MAKSILIFAKFFSNCLLKLEEKQALEVRKFRARSSCLPSIGCQTNKNWWKRNLIQTNFQISKDISQSRHQSSALLVIYGLTLN